MGQVSAPASALSLASQTDKTIEDLRQVARDLNESVKSFYAHLDQAMARHDRGYRAENGRTVQSADADLIGGPSDVTWATIRKFFTFRLLATAEAGSRIHDPAAADLERIQALIVEARKRVDDSTPALRRLLVVSVADYVPGNEAIAKNRHDQLLRARAAAEEAAQKAMLALPLDQPEDSAPDQTAQNGWDAMGRSVPAPTRPAQVANLAQTSAKTTLPPVPIAFGHRQRVTVINEGAYRMAMTDSGIEDEEGRHVFYQEEWVQRGQSVIRYRWRVGVETASGHHILLKRYPARELIGALEDVYGHRDRDYVWYLRAARRFDGTSARRNRCRARDCEALARCGPGRRAGFQKFNALGP